MAYSTDNPPQLIASGLGGKGRRMWAYQSNDAAAAVRVSNYFTNGYHLGLRAGDTVLVVDEDATPIALQVMIVSESTATVCDLSDGTAITATDTD